MAVQQMAIIELEGDIETVAGERKYDPEKGSIATLQNGRPKLRPVVIGDDPALNSSTHRFSPYSYQISETEVTRFRTAVELTLAERALVARDARALLYARASGEGGLSEGRESQIEAIGDCLDTLFTQIETMRIALIQPATADYADKIAKIAAIKTAVPPPE